MANPRPLTEEGDGRAVPAPSLDAFALSVAQGPAGPLNGGGAFGRLPAPGPLATTIFPDFQKWITNLLSPKSPAAISLAIASALIGVYVDGAHPDAGLCALRDGIFAEVQYHALREVGVSTFAHVHTLSLRFHLERKTGGLSRVIERGTKGIDTLSVIYDLQHFPTLLQLVFSRQK